MGRAIAGGGRPGLLGVLVLTLLAPAGIRAGASPHLPGLVPSNPFLVRPRHPSPSAVAPRPAGATEAKPASPRAASASPGAVPGTLRPTPQGAMTAGKRLHQPRLVPVLTFHDLSERFDPKSILTPVERFGQIMRWFAKNRYQTFFASEIPELLAGRSRRLKRAWRPVVLTFDDGYVNNYRLLLPILRRFDARATIFLIVSKVVERRAWARSNALTWFEVRKMARSGHVEFGSHTFALHYDLARLERLSGGSKRFARQVYLDLYTSKTVLEGEIGSTVSALAWPHGKRSARLTKIAAKAGFTMVFNTRQGVIEPGRHEMLDLPRLNASTPFMTVSALKRRIEEALVRGAWAEELRARRVAVRGAE